MQGAKAIAVGATDQLVHIVGMGQKIWSYTEPWLKVRKIMTV